MDGFGLREETEGNAVHQAATPNIDKMREEYSESVLQASGEHVGLPIGVVGGSEVGHSVIGAGRIIKAEELIVNDMFSKNELDENPVFKEAISYIKGKDRDVHLMILCSDGRVHSNLKHLLLMMEKLKDLGIRKIYLHLITDGRDTETHASFKYIKIVKDSIKILKVGTIATICGRYYAMDRDNNWERTQKYADLLTRGVGIETESIMKTIQACYLKNVTDEFIPPILVTREGLIKNGDMLFWLNFRTDRAKQILLSLTNADFEEFQIKKLTDLKLVTLFPVDKKVKGKYLLEENPIENTLGTYFSDLGLTQARVAETEKYQHVTSFFDSEINKKLDGCDTYHIPTPRENPDLKPEMNALEVCNTAIKCMEKDYDFILVNFCNPDMVGHTGDMLAAIKAVQVVDLCIGKLIEAAEENFYTIILTADHGNAELMNDEEGNPLTAHTMNPVPFVIRDKKVKLKPEGDLTQVAPTILEYMDIAIPKEMKETPSLLKSK